jgi:biotin operon repressor
MQFEPRLRHGLRDGSITVTFRRWRRVQVVAGHQYRTGAGLVRAESIEVIAPDGITPALAGAAGYPDVQSAVADLRGDPELPVYCIRFRALDGPDPRDELARTDDLSDADVAVIRKRLARLDAASKRGPWTTDVLAQIDSRPAVSSAVLAAELDWDRPDYKLHVRHLKALGLTISLDVGYRLSPRGSAFVARTSGPGE